MILKGGYMKKVFLIVGLSAVTAVCCATQIQGTVKLYAVSPRKIEIGSTEKIVLCKDGKAAFEVVKPANPAASGAAKELIQRLYQITGKKVKLTAKASGKVPAFYLGSCPEAEKLGLKPEKLDRDGYYIKTDGNRIFITGADGGTGTRWQNATMFGVYDFLERFGGVRWYFPGEIGTIVPVKKNWSLPEIDIIERPDTQCRRIYCYPARRPPLDSSKYYYPGLNAKNCMLPSWRQATRRTLGAQHGLNAIELTGRFAKTHPEYFALTKDGKRFDHTYSRNLKSDVYGHICFSSEGLKNEIYLDAVAALTGKPASTRGISKWNYQWDPEGVSICPNDGIYWCQCPPCKEVEKKGKKAINDHIWKFRVDIANRLKKNNIPGYVTANSYAQFSEMPAMELPENLNISISTPGPWSMKIPRIRNREEKRISAWVERIGHKINSGTYATKVLAPVPDIPCFTPRATGAFLKAQKNYFYGCFFEVGSDCWLFDFMNCYVFSKVMWNMDTDVEALIAEHCQLMFGKAAPYMNKFYQTIEELWMNRIVNGTVQTSIGEKWKLATMHEVWTKIYSPAKIKEISAILDQAEKAAAADKKSLERVKFLRKYMWERVVRASRTYIDDISDRSAWTIRAADAGKIAVDGVFDEPEWQKTPAAWLNVNPMRRNEKAEKVEVHTRVRMLQDKDNFYFAIEADEPETSRIVADPGRKIDDMDLWRDNGAEIFLSAGADSDFIYQFIFNSAGAKCDLKNGLHKVDPAYDSGFEVKTRVIPGKMWTAEVRIPRSALPELSGRKQIAGNFTRHRVLKGKAAFPGSYVWLPKPKNTPEYCGVIRMENAAAPVNLIKDGDFAVPYEKYHAGAWAVARRVLPENEVFVTAGTSLRLEQNTYYAMQTVPVKPGKRYKVSFYVRTENLYPGLRGTLLFGGSPARNIPVFDHNRRILSGTNKWQRVVKYFRAPEVFGTKYKPQITFLIGKKSSGRCWIDHVELTELK